MWGRPCTQVCGVDVGPGWVTVHLPGSGDDNVGRQLMGVDRKCGVVWMGM